MLSVFPGLKAKFSVPEKTGSIAKRRRFFFFLSVLGAGLGNKMHGLKSQPCQRLSGWCWLDSNGMAFHIHPQAMSHMRKSFQVFPRQLSGGGVLVSIDGTWDQ